MANEANKGDHLWISDDADRFFGTQARGFTHLCVGGSHTGLSGDHTPNHGVSPTKYYIKVLILITNLVWIDRLTYLTNYI